MLSPRWQPRLLLRERLRGRERSLELRRLWAFLWQQRHLQVGNLRSRPLLQLSPGQLTLRPTQRRGLLLPRRLSGSGNESQDCQACGQSCTPCSRPTTGCTQGQGCTVDKLCAPLSCTGLSDGMACSLPDLVPSPPRAPAAFSSSTVARFSSPSAAAALAPTWTSTPRTAAPAACAAQPGPLARVEFATRRSTALPPRAEAPAGSGQGAGRGSAVVAPHASTSIPT